MKHILLLCIFVRTFAMGCVQLCGGQIYGIAAAVRSTFTLDENDTVLMVKYDWMNILWEGRDDVLEIGPLPLGVFVD